MNHMIAQSLDRSYDRISVQADKLRVAIRYIDNAKKLIPRTLLVQAAEERMEGIDDLFDKMNAILAGSLEPIDALLNEMEQ